MPIWREKLKRITEMTEDKGIAIEQYIPARVSVLSVSNDSILTLENKDGFSLDLI